MEIKEPVVLAKLPRPFQTYTPHKCGAVYGLAAGQKRKRHEVSVAIEGNSVNIYEIEHGGIQASYAVSPAVSFVCSPTSLRVKTGKHTYTRYTYCATKKQSQYRLDCFEESFVDNQSQGVVSSSATVLEQAGDVEHLEAISRPETVSTGGNDHVVAALYQSGALGFYLPGLRGKQTSVQLPGLSTSSDCHSILATRWLTFKEAQKSMLKHRPDLLASTDPDSAFLTMLHRRKSGPALTAHVSIWGITLRGTTSSGSLISQAAEITTYHLPDVPMWAQETGLHCSFNPLVSSVLITGTTGVANFDLTSYTPRVTWHHQLKDQGISSVRINNSFVVTSSTKSLCIHDHNYMTSRATLDLTQIGNKRKREQDDIAPHHGFVTILGYFRELGKLVTLRRNHLISFELGGTQKESTLIDNIASGELEAVKSHSNTASMLDIGFVDDLSGLPTKEWEVLQQNLKIAADGAHVARFEEILFNAEKGSDVLHRLSDQQIEYVISKLFRWTSLATPNPNIKATRQYDLEVTIPASRVLSSLVDRGFITRHIVQHALRSTQESGKLVRVEPGMIAAALIKSDPALVLLNQLLQSAELLDAAELAATLPLLIDEVLSKRDAEQSVEPFHQPSDQANGLMDTDNNDHTTEVSFQEQSNSNTNTESPFILRVLIATLEKFARFGPIAITDGLRQNLSQTQIGTLIQILRQQLFEGQHTSSVAPGAYYTSASNFTGLSLEDRISEPCLSLGSTSKIMVGCIDAIGSFGFLTDASEDGFLTQVIPELKSETAMATQSIEEAVYLRGILRETIRYAKSVDVGAFSDTTLPAMESTVVPLQRPGTIVTVYSEPTIEQGDINTQSSVLPLSLRAENTVSLAKVRKGGGQVKERSLREMREMENRSKGVYSLERLVL